MKKIILGLLVISQCVASRAAADPISSVSALSQNSTLIDFESVISIPNPFVVGDVTFTSLTGHLSILTLQSPNWSVTTGEVSSRALFSGGEPDSAISIAFANPIAQFLVGWGDPNFSGNVLRAYSSSGLLLEEAHVALGPTGGVFATWIGFSRSTADIAMILVQPDQSRPSGDDYVLDNIRYNTTPYNTTPVPEPSTLILLATGTIGVGLRKLRNHRALSRS